MAVADGDALKEMCGKKSHASSTLNMIVKLLADLRFREQLHSVLILHLFI